MLQDKKIDKSVPIPLYFQLKQLLVAEIENGTYPPESLIPTENELCEMFDISRTTVRQAILELVQEGRFYRVKGKGTFVSPPKVRQSLMQRYRSLHDEIREQGGSPSIQVLALEVVDMPQKLAALRGEEGQGKKAVFLSRTHYSDGRPFVHTETYLPYEDYAFILDHDFTRERLYSVLAIYPQRRVERLTREIEAVAASPADQKFLGVERGAPVHSFKNISYNPAGEVIEMSFARYRGDCSVFQVDMMLTEEYAPRDA